MSKTAALITHSHPPAATQAVTVVAAVAQEMGWRLVATAGEVAKHDHAASGVEQVEELPRDPDLCLVLGGDGSILFALREFARTGVPVFGVNFGTVGFLAAVERDEAEAGIRRAFAGETETIDLPALAIEADGEERFALNDVSFSRRPHDRVAELSYRIAGEEVGNVRCDGLVAATPAGSTGYNLANQGPILAWGVKGYVVSYISPHSLTARARRRPGRRAQRRQRRGPRAGRRRDRRRPGRHPRAGRVPRRAFCRRRQQACSAPRHELLSPNQGEVRTPRRLKGDAGRGETSCTFSHNAFGRQPNHVSPKKLRTYPCRRIPTPPRRTPEPIC
jgi:NAD+ kinase